MPPLSRDQTTEYLVDLENAANNKKNSYEGRVKCVLVGDGAVGKTSLVVSYTTNGYPTEYVPTAFDNYNVVVTVDNHPIRLQLCDTAGQDDFDSLRPLCYPGTDVFLLCFSVVSPTSFHNVIDKWMPEIKHHSPSTPIILVGTQCDLRSDVKVLIELANYGEQPVSENEARRLANKMALAAYVECSALTQKNLKEVFDTAIVIALKRNEALQRLTTQRGKNNNNSGKGGKKNNLLHPKGGNNNSSSPMFGGKNNSYNNNNKIAFFQQHQSDMLQQHSSKMAEKKKKGWKKLCCFS